MIHRELVHTSACKLKEINLFGLFNLSLLIFLKRYKEIALDMSAWRLAINVPEP